MGVGVGDRDGDGGAEGLTAGKGSGGIDVDGADEPPFRNPPFLSCGQPALAFEASRRTLPRPVAPPWLWWVLGFGSLRNCQRVLGIKV
jgi:hypothetical protein